jgi:hypothetical protein
MKDFLISGVRSRGMLTKNETVLEVKDSIGIITKHVEFCFSEKFLDDLGKIDATIPFDLSEKDLNAIKNAIVSIRGSEDCAYKNFDDPEIVAKYKRFEYTEVTLDGDKFTVPKNASYIKELSKVYMPEFKKYMRLENLKLQ